LTNIIVEMSAIMVGFDKPRGLVSVGVEGVEMSADMFQRRKCLSKDQHIG